MSDLPDIQKIIWLASYPKSGNTWLRAFLANLRSKSDAPVNINSMGGGPIASDRAVFDELMGLESSDLNAAEIAHYRAAASEYRARLSQDRLFVKIHDAFTTTDTGVPIVPRAATMGVIYVVRNPLDVAVSYAHHMGLPIEKTVKVMGQEHHVLTGSGRGLSQQLTQRLLTWSQHIRSWVDISELPVHVVRYEDMIYHPVESFTAIARFAQLSDDPEQIERAITFSSFDVLQGQEREHGFGEKPIQVESFFRQGKVGNWRDVLSDEQVAHIVRDHREMMRRFGYLTDMEMIVY
jgi:hypothetical protein